LLTLSALIAGNLHFQFSKNIEVDGVEIYQFPDAANADGIDVDRCWCWCC